MLFITIPNHLKEIAAIFNKAGFKVYLVGGAVRDMILGKKPVDFDIATDARPEQVATLFRHIIPTGIKHGTVTISYQGKHVECTTFRSEQGYSDGRHPDTITYAHTIEDDLSRRDFTMNAIAISVPAGDIIDPFGGRSDIYEGLIRTVGDAHERFSEDGLRLMRAVRFASQLNFTIDKDTLKAIPSCVSMLLNVSQERIRDEFSKIVLSNKPSIGLRCMEQTGMLRIVLPELCECRGVRQKANHKFDVLDHLFFACDVCPENDLTVKLAALFHDIGKPRVMAFDEAGIVTFYHHDAESSRIAKRIMSRLRFSNKEITETCHLIEQHMFHYEPNWTDAAVRRFIARVGEAYLEPLFVLRMADSWAIAGERGSLRSLDDFRDRIIKVSQEAHAFTIKDLAVNGTDLINAGIKGGPLLGKILQELLDSVLDDPSLNTPKHLLEIALAINAERALRHL